MREPTLYPSKMIMSTFQCTHCFSLEGHKQKTSRGKLNFKLNVKCLKTNYVKHDSKRNVADAVNTINNWEVDGSVSNCWFWWINIVCIETCGTDNIDTRMCFRQCIYHCMVNRKMLDKWSRIYAILRFTKVQYNRIANIRKECFVE